MRTLYLTGALCLCALLLSNREAAAQNSNVSIGTGSIKSNAILWLKANGNQGFLLPVVADHDNFTGLNNSDDKGMVVFDSSDGKVYYWDGSAWVGVGAGASAANQLLTLAGNTLSLTGAPGSNVNISTSAPTAGQALVWSGTAWTSVSLAGDVTGAQGTTTVGGLKGRAIPNLPATANALVYDGSAWVFQPLTSSGEANTASNVGTSGAGVFKQKTGTNLEFNKLNAGSNRVSVVADPANSEVDIDVVQANLSLAATQITGLGPLATVTAVGSAQITDGAITGADIATTTITADKLAQSGATTNQVLQWNGTNWVPGTASGSGTVTSVTTGTGLTGGPITSAGTIGIATGGVTATELAANAVTSAKIADATITGPDIAATTITADKLAQSGATANQVLQWDGTNWIPATPSGTGTVISVTTGTGLSGGPITSTGTISIAAGGVTVTELAANAVTSAKITDATITGADIAGATITDTNIANTTITAGKLAQSGAAANQILQWNGTNWVPANSAAGTVTSVATGTGLTGGPISATGTISIAAGGVGVTELAANAVNTGKIADGTITGADVASATITGSNIAATTITGANIAATTITDSNIANTTITAGKLAQSGAAANQVLQWNGTNWVPANATAGWGLTGNTGTIAGTNYVGTSDDQPVEFKVNNVRVMRYELDPAPTTAGVLSPNIIGGHSANSALAGIKGAVISGGGLDNPNLVNGDWATIAGGRDNQAGLMAPYSAYSSIGGGASNRSTGQWSTVAGGKNNTANGSGTAIPGGLRLIATAQGSTVVGTANEDPGALGYSSTSWAASDPVFIIGNGQVDGGGNMLTRSNAMTVLKNGNVGIGISDPTAKVDIIGTIKIADGTQGANKVLTSDANGLASWQNPAATAAGILPGNGNTGIGTNVLQNNSGDYNAAFGAFSLISNTTGNFNAALGYNALRNNSTTSGNVAVGYYALQTNLTAGYNTAVGWHALYSTTAGNNVGIGRNAGEGANPNTTGTNNTFIGANTGPGPGGPYNKATAIGYGALVSQSNSIALGGTGVDAVKVGINTEAPAYTLTVSSATNAQMALASTNATSDVFFGTTATPQEGLIRYNNTSDQFQIGLSNGTVRYYLNGTGMGIFRTAAVNALEVEGNASNTTASAWLANSDRRIKTDIRDIDNSFELIKSLRPVKFKYTEEWKRKHPSIKDQYYYNFIAQEYQQVFPESVKSSGEFVDGDAQPVIQIDTYNAQIAAIKAVQELILKVEALEAENAKLKSENGELESRLGSFEEKQQAMLKDLEALKQVLGTTSKE
jgi:trimeric autotransporter adhesin